MIKITLAVILLCIVAISAEKQEVTPYNAMDSFKLLPFDFCTANTFVRGFFTGTEPDPKVPNSKCVMYFPELETQFNKLVDSFNMTALIPTRALGVLDNTATFINRFALWMRYCEFGQLFGKLDNTLETLEGFVSVFYRFTLNYSKVFIQLGDLSVGYQAKNCFNMMKAMGVIFSILFDFQVPEDIS